MSQPESRLKSFYDTAASAGAEVVEVHFKPPDAGIIWDILWCQGEQDDGDVQCGWKWYDPENPAGVQLHVTSVSRNIPLPFGALAPSEQGPGAAPITATYSRYPAYFFVASGAGKTGVVTGIVAEQIGVEGAL